MPTRRWSRPRQNERTAYQPFTRGPMPGMTAALLREAMVPRGGIEPPTP